MRIAAWKQLNLPFIMKREKNIFTTDLNVKNGAVCVEKIDDHTSRFYAEVYDATELIPWIRTFICRITDIHISNIIVETQFKRDLEKMYQLYGIGGEEK